MSPQVFFAVEDGSLRISTSDSAWEWRGRPDDMAVLDLRVTSDGEAAIVLLDPPGGQGRIRNLVKVLRDGRVAWRGELPPQDSTDCFVSVDIGPDLDRHVIAGTWSGYSVRLDPTTGRLLSQKFTK